MAAARVEFLWRKTTRQLAGGVDRAREAVFHHDLERTLHFDLASLAIVADDSPIGGQYSGQLAGSQREAQWGAIGAVERQRRMHGNARRIKQVAFEFADEGAIEQLLLVGGEKGLGLHTVAGFIDPALAAVLQRAGQHGEVLQGLLLLCVWQLVENQPTVAVVQRAAAGRTDATETNDYGQMRHG